MSPDPLLAGGVWARDYLPLNLTASDGKLGAGLGTRLLFRYVWWICRIFPEEPQNHHKKGQAMAQERMKESSMCGRKHLSWEDWGKG